MELIEINYARPKRGIIERDEKQRQRDRIGLQEARRLSTWEKEIVRQEQVQYSSNMFRDTTIKIKLPKLSRKLDNTNEFFEKVKE